MQVIAALGDIDGALPHAEKVLENGADSPLANFIVGSAALRKGEFKTAGEYLRKAAKSGMPAGIDGDRPRETPVFQIDGGRPRETPVFQAFQRF